MSFRSSPATSRLRLMLAATVAVLQRWSGRRLGLALMYHRVGERTGDPDRELVPAHGVALFEAQLRHLKRHYRVVPASELLSAALGRRRGERFPAAITFDDDLASHARLALPLLRKLGLTATFFVSGASLERPFAFWWERLQAAADRGLDVKSVLPAGARPRQAREHDSDSNGLHAVAATIETLRPEQRRTVSERLGSLIGPDPGDSGMRREQLSELAAAGFEIGFHTLRHDALPFLDDAELERALTEGRDRVAAIAGREPSTIGYPHGRADARVATAARDAGYQFGFTTRQDAARPGSDPLLIGRVEPSFISPGHFATQLWRTLSRKPPAAGDGNEGGGRG